MMATGLLGLIGVGWYGSKHVVYSVDSGHMAIKYSKLGGLKSNVYREGYHLLMPWFERPIVFDVRSHPRNFKSKTGSKDLQMVDLTVRILYKPNPDKLVDVYRYVGRDFDERVLPSLVHEVLKSIIA